MQFLKLLAGPMIGALIGYGTNYIAVKMLFRPRHAVKLGRFTLPFTPGIIPRRKQALAHAIGAAVGDTLLTGEDLKSALSNSAAQERVVEGITDAVCADRRVCDLMKCIVPAERSADLFANLEDILCEKIAHALIEIDVSGILAMEGGGAIREAMEGTMFAMFLTDDLIRSLAIPIGDRFRDAVLKNKDKILRPAIHKELMAAGESSLPELLQQAGLDRTAIQSLIAEVYQKLVLGHLDVILEGFDIAAIVEQKMNAMKEEEIEELVLSVMKQELNAIVRLGALIGFLIGLLNLLFL